MAKKNDRFDLNRKGSLFQKLEPVRTVSRDLYDGEDTVKAKREKYLFKSPYESDEAYEYRLKRAVYDNWLGVVIDTRVALMSRKPPTRNKMGNVEQFVRDIDGKKTHADTFFKNVLQNASVDGLHWVLVDKTPLPEIVETQDGKRFAEINGEIVPVGPEGFSLAQEKALGIRPFAVAIPASSVTDWDEDNFDWAVIASSRTEKAGPGYDPEVIPQRIVWFRNAWAVYEPEDPTKADAELKWKLVNMGAHNLNEVPLVPAYGFKVADYYGVPVAKDVKGHVVSIYNKFSDRDFSEWLTNNPVPWLKAPENPGRVEIGGMNGIFLSTSEGKDTGCGYLEPTGSGVTASRESERDLIRRIREIALQQAQKDTAQVQSADTLRQSAMIYNSSLASGAVQMGATESHVWRLFAKWMDSENEIGPDEFSVEYSSDFDDNTIEAAFVKVMSDAQRAGQISRQTLWEIWKRGEVLPPDFDPKKEKDLIQKDREADAMPGAEEEVPGDPADDEIDPEDPTT